MDEIEQPTTDELHTCEQQVGIMDRKHAEEVAHSYKNDHDTEQEHSEDIVVFVRKKILDQLILKFNDNEDLLKIIKNIPLCDGMVKIVEKENSVKDEEQELLSADEERESEASIQHHLLTISHNGIEQELENSVDSSQDVPTTTKKHLCKTQEEPQAFGDSLQDVPQDAMKQQSKVQVNDLTVKNVLKFIEDVADWYGLGIQLNFRTGQLDIIKADHPNDVVRAKTKMISLWLNNDPHASWKMLAATLKEIGHGRVVHGTMSQYYRHAAKMKYSESSMECSHAASKQDGGQVFEVSMEFSDVSPQDTQEPEASLSKSKDVPQDSCLMKDEEQSFDISSEECLQVEEQDSETSIQCLQDNSQQDGQQDAKPSVESLRDVSQQEKEEDSEASVKRLPDITQQDTKEEPENSMYRSTDTDQASKKTLCKIQEQKKSPEIEKLSVLNVEKAIHSVAKWNQLGIHLEIEAEQLEIIKRDCPDVADARISMITFWLNNVPNPSWKKLAEALEAIGNRKLSHEISLQHGLVRDQDQEANIEEYPKDVTQNERKCPNEIQDGNYYPKDSTECPENIGSEQELEKAAELNDDQQGVMIAQDNQQGDQLNLKFQHCHEHEQAAELHQDEQPLEFHDDHFNKPSVELETTILYKVPATRDQMPDHEANHGAISSQEAKYRLMQKGGTCFLIRYSASKDVHILSVTDSKEKVCHLELRVNQDEPSYTILGTEKKFNSLNQLIKYYQTNPINPYITSIGSPCRVHQCHKCSIL